MMTIEFATATLFLNS